MKSLSCVRLFATPWTIAYHVPLPMGILQARILEWVAISFSRGSSQPRDRTPVSCIAGRRFTLWATREALWKFLLYSKVTQFYTHPHRHTHTHTHTWLPRWLRGKESACQARDVGSIPGLERSPGEADGNSLQYSFLENPMDRSLAD